jgi:calcium/calmodulin-dependent protein kinase I
MAKARLRRGIEMVKLANRIEALRIQEDESETAPGEADVPADAKAAAGAALSGGADLAAGMSVTCAKPGGKKSLGNAVKGAIFREVVLATVRDKKEQEQALKVEKEAHEKEAKRRSFQG